MSELPVTVITVTVGRLEMLLRAAQSVRAQDYAGDIEHLIVIDDDATVSGKLADLPSDERRVLRWHTERRPPSERGPEATERASVYPRLARLLNVGVRRASSPWLAFLDDDNLYEPDHLSSLMECARAHDCQAVHSARRMYWEDGTPYLDPLFPHTANPAEAARIYELMCRRGVWVRGTNILRDRVDSGQHNFNNSTILGDNDPIFLVDQNVWLIDRELMLKYPMSEEFSVADIAANTCPDDKMLETLVRNNVRIVSSNKPTVLYFLGGVSNR